MGNTLHHRRPPALYDVRWSAVMECVGMGELRSGVSWGSGMGVEWLMGCVDVYGF